MDVLRLQRWFMCLESVSFLTVSMPLSVQERHGVLEETVAETDPRAGALCPTYRNADRKQNHWTLVCSKHWKQTVIYELYKIAQENM